MLVREQERDCYFDNAKFLLIAFVFIGHAIEPFREGNILPVIYKVLYLFHMPCFVFITGYFSKRHPIQKVGDFLYAYVVFQAVYLFVNARTQSAPLDLQWTTPFWSMWYLLAAVVWKLLYPQLIKWKHPVIWSFLLALLIGFEKTVNIYLTLSRIIVFLPFFVLGYTVRRETFMKLKRIPKAVPVAVIVLTCIIFSKAQFRLDFIYHCWSYRDLNPDLNHDAFYGLLVRSIILIGNVVLSCCFFCFVPEKKTWYTQLGTRSLQVYLLHFFVVWFLKFWPVTAYVTTYSTKILLLAGVFGLTVLFSAKPFEMLMNPLIRLDWIRKLYGRIVKNNQ